MKLKVGDLRKRNDPSAQAASAAEARPQAGSDPSAERAHTPDTQTTDEAGMSVEREPPGVEPLAPDKAQTRLARYDHIQGRFVRLVERQLDLLERTELQPQQAAVVMGICVDKLRPMEILKRELRDASSDARGLNERVREFERMLAEARKRRLVD